MIYFPKHVWPIILPFPECNDVVRRYFELYVYTYYINQLLLSSFYLLQFLMIYPLTFPSYFPRPHTYWVDIVPTILPFVGSITHIFASKGVVCESHFHKHVAIDCLFLSSSLCSGSVNNGVGRWLQHTKWIGWDNLHILTLNE